jgi:hypothetical protein
MGELLEHGKCVTQNASAVMLRQILGCFAGYGLRMRFAAREVWPDSPGAPGDTLALRISEDQLEPFPTKAS